MPRPDVRVEVDTAELNRILRALPGNLFDSLRAAAFSIEAKAKVKAPVDTGALRSSIYTVVRGAGAKRDDGFDDAARAVHERSVQAEVSELPQPGEMEAHVGPCVEYGLYVEMGTERMGAQPYLTPAVREVEGELARHFAGVAGG